MLKNKIKSINEVVDVVEDKGFVHLNQFEHQLLKKKQNLRKQGQIEVQRDRPSHKNFIN